MARFPGVLLLVALHAAPALAQAGSDPSPTNVRDGQHDFDFEIGAWKTRLSRLLRPLTGSTAWVEYEGTSVVRRILDGRANLVELSVAGAAGRIEGLSLRLYDPHSRRWSLHFANGRGEFYGSDTLDGKPILVRFVIAKLTSDSWRFEQAFSADDGKTWEVNWIAIDTRTDP